MCKCYVYFAVYMVGSDQQGLTTCVWCEKSCGKLVKISWQILLCKVCKIKVSAVKHENVGVN